MASASSIHAIAASDGFPGSTPSILSSRPDTRDGASGGAEGGQPEGGAICQSLCRTSDPGITWTSPARNGCARSDPIVQSRSDLRLDASECTRLAGAKVDHGDP